MAEPLAAGSGLFIPVEWPTERERLLALNPRGTRLAVSCKDADFVQIFDPRSGKEVARCDGFFRIFAVTFLSADVLLVAAFHGLFRCDLRRGTRDQLSSEAWLGGAAVSPNGRVVAIGKHGGIDLYDLRTGQVSRRPGTNYTYNQWARRFAFSPGGRYLAAEFSNEADREPTIVVVWDARTGDRQRIFDTEAHAFAFRGDTLTLAVADDHGQVALYEPDHGEEPAARFQILNPWHGECGDALQFRDGGRKLAVLMGSGDFALLDPKTGRITRRLPPPGEYSIFRTTTSADWSRFAGEAEGGVVTWPGDTAKRKAPARRSRK